MLAFNKQNTTRLTRLVTPQAERNPGTRLLVRASDAPVWPANEWEQFDRFLIFGTERGSYFMRKRKLSVHEASNARARIVEDGPRAVRRIVEISVMGRVVTNDTCLFALAMAAVLGNAATRVMALEAVPDVARTDAEARTFAMYVEDLGAALGDEPNTAQIPRQARPGGEPATAPIISRRIWSAPARATLSFRGEASRRLIQGASPTVHAREDPLARKPNYDFEKRRKEQDRKAEKEEKMRRKREKSANEREQAAATEPAEPTPSE